jgi:type I restriction enzyme, S subunit
MAAYAVPLGTETERCALNDVVEPNVTLLQSLAARNATLRNLRDLLLPKLLSGEIDVSGLPFPPEAP